MSNTGGQNYLGTGYGPGGQRAKATREVAMVLRERTTNLAQILEGEICTPSSLFSLLTSESEVRPDRRSHYWL